MRRVAGGNASGLQVYQNETEALQLFDATRAEHSLQVVHIELTHQQWQQQPKGIGPDRVRRTKAVHSTPGLTPLSDVAMRWLSGTIHQYVRVRELQEGAAIRTLTPLIPLLTVYINNLLKSL